MAKVFIPNLPTRYDNVTQKRIPSIDLNPASVFGELQPIFEGKPSNYDDAFDAIEDCIKGEMMPGDYILSVGDVILVAAAILYANEAFDCARVLRWDRQQHRYEKVEVKL